MWMELHDNETGNTLNSGIGSAEKPAIDYDYQAEQWVIDTHDNIEIVKWILFDGQGQRCVWEREPGDKRLPVISFKADRYQGEYSVEHAD